MNLTRQERKGIFAGTLKVLRRTTKPDQEAGAKVIVSQTRGGKQIVDKATGATVDIPRQPNLWIVIKGWHLRQGSTEWETEITIHDQREPNRMLAGGVATGIQREPGLKTRQGTPKVESWNPETERGYVGGGRSAIDDVAAVDDATLNDFARRIEEENEILRNQRRHDHRKMAEESRLARQRKQRKPQAVSAIKRRIEETDKQLAAA